MVTEDVGVADCARPIGAIAVGGPVHLHQPRGSADVVSVLTVKGDSVVGAPAPATAA